MMPWRIQQSATNRMTIANQSRPKNSYWNTGHGLRTMKQTKRHIINNKSINSFLIDIGIVILYWCMRVKESKVDDNTKLFDIHLTLAI